MLQYYSVCFNSGLFNTTQNNIRKFYSTKTNNIVQELITFVVVWCRILIGLFQFQEKPGKAFVRRFQMLNINIHPSIHNKIIFYIQTFHV